MGVLNFIIEHYGTVFIFLRLTAKCEITFDTSPCHLPAFFDTYLPHSAARRQNRRVLTSTLTSLVWNQSAIIRYGHRSHQRLEKSLLFCFITKSYWCFVLFCFFPQLPQYPKKTHTGTRTPCILDTLRNRTLRFCTVRWRSKLVFRCANPPLQNI